MHHIASVILIFSFYFIHRIVPLTDFHFEDRNNSHLNTYKYERHPSNAKYFYQNVFPSSSSIKHLNQGYSKKRNRLFSKLNNVYNNLKIITDDEDFHKKLFNDEASGDDNELHHSGDDSSPITDNFIIDITPVPSPTQPAIPKVRPKVQVNPSQQTVRSGDTLRIDCSATGDHPIDIEWSKIDSPLSSKADISVGRLIVSDVKTTDAGQYLCTAINDAGKAEAISKVIVEEESEIKSISRDETTYVGSNIELTCDYRGSEYIRWTKDDGPLPNNSREVNNELWIRNVTRDNAGRYICTKMSHQRPLSRDYIKLNVKAPEITNPECSRSEFQCRDGTCIDIRLRCNKRYECVDYSDEYDCRETPSVNVKIIASKTEAHIGDVLTLECRVTGDSSAQIVWRHEGYERFAANVHSRDGFLIFQGIRNENAGMYRCEVNSQGESYKEVYFLQVKELDIFVTKPTTIETTVTYGTALCKIDQFQCVNDQCIPQSLRCDKKYDCTDGSDEYNCAFLECQQNQYRCFNGQCIDRSKRCNRYYDCLDGSDEANCHGEAQCTEKQFRCNNGLCIDNKKRCDSSRDCPDGSDELSCTNLSPCNEKQFQCGDGRCIDLYKKCDRRNDCLDASDELHCQIATQCTHNQFRCTDGKCIDISKRCDRSRDCFDGIDELNCPIECTHNQFRCTDGKCIDIFKRCDRSRDCFDGIDELNCPIECTANQFRCTDGQCIDNARKCDRRRDCLDGSDEVSCRNATVTHCGHNQFRCFNGHCIEWSLRCNLYYDCLDGSDEANCDVVTQCTEKQFRCNDGQCIDDSKRCDESRDCTDGSDESYCQISTHCSQHQFRCSNGECINIFKRCDRNRDCSDGGDELNCPNVTHCTANQFRCADGRCIDNARKCDRRRDCLDGSDELSCRNATVTHCDHNQFRCFDGHCIEWSLRCNLYYDCYDGSDEANCDEVTRCNEKQFRCNNGQCIDVIKRCNGNRDCTDGSDESYCQIAAQCTHNQFQCTNGECIDISKRCDRNRDCFDGIDELNCPIVTECNNKQFRCTDGQCIDAVQRCDRRYDCLDGSDELSCRNVTHCDRNQFRCSDGHCIELSKHCNLYYDCFDGSDEVNCNEEAKCNEKQFRCNNGQCIDTDRRCDKNRDCADGSDELSCQIVTHCVHNQFRCTDGQCIDSVKRCDRRYDCSDGSDELLCQITTHCTHDQFRCTDGKCIDISKKCDRNRDCSDGIDELNCPIVTECIGNQFRCANGQCIDPLKRCDRKHDCLDGSDELSCQIELCAINAFECADGRCISQSLRCDGYYDCIDFSDEQNCDTHTCRLSQFRCENGQCIDRALLCNGVGDCPDRYDEINCGICDAGDFVCANGKCVDSKQRCDGVFDCSDYSDEVDCISGDVDVHIYPEKQNIRQGQEIVYRCRDESPNRLEVKWSRSDRKELPPQSSDIRGRLTLVNVQPEHGGIYICTAVGAPSGSPTAKKAAYLTVHPYFLEPSRNVTTKSPRTSGQCTKNEMTCHNGECIHREYVCDGDYDCTDQSDELNCVHHCDPNQFQCDNQNCLLKIWRCDGDDDCGDKSDEKFCEPSLPNSPCRNEEFRCESVDQCIPRSYQCDGEFDCQDKTDEIGCSPPIIVKPPNETIIATEGDTINITCRAIGIPQPIISWRWNWNHVPGPPRVTSTNKDGLGTITIRDVKESDQGAWSCEAINSKDSKLAANDALLVVRPKDSICHPPTFNDKAKYPTECLRCFCFGVTNMCHSSIFRITSIPLRTQIRVIPFFKEINGSYTDASRMYPPNQEYIRYIPSTGEYRLTGEVAAQGTPDNVYFYWSLPVEFLGNKIHSYGGYLKYTVRYREPYVARPPEIADVIIRGNGITLYHVVKSGNDQRGDKTVKIRFWEGQWHKSEAHGRSDIPPLFDVTTREDIMIALQNIEFIHIKATYDETLIDSSILNLEMDMAVLTNASGTEQALFVEKCTCPDGYLGSSCEECELGYSRHPIGRYLGRCVRQAMQCNCNGHSDQCDQNTGACINCRDNTEGTQCERCTRGYYGDPSLRSGDSCRPCPCPHIQPSNQFSPVCHLDPTDGDITCDACPIGFDGRRCERCAPGYSGDPNIFGGTCELQGATEPIERPPANLIRVQIEEPRVQRVPTGATVTFRCTGISEDSDFTYNLVWTKDRGSLPSRASEASGILTIPDVRPQYSGTYVCTGSNLESVAQDHATLIVDTSDQPTLPRVRIEPYYQEVNVGDSVEFRCISEGYPPPELRWTGGRDGVLNPTSTFLNGVFRIPYARKSDESEYFCIATNAAGTDNVRTILFVKGEDRPDRPDGGKPHVTVHPVTYEAKRGETVRFECHVSGNPLPDLSWSFSEGDLPAESRQIGGSLILSRVTEALQGLYTCTARNAHGTTQAQARLTLEFGRSIPTARIEPESQTIIQGQSGELRCITSGNPPPTVSWQKVGGDLTQSRQRVDGNILVIENAIVEDRGLYTCRSDNREGSAQATATVEIERREVPSVEIYPESSQTVMIGGSALFQCRVMAGIPSPTIEWRKSDGSPFRSSTEILDGGVIRFNQVTGDEDGTYMCAAENTAGRVTAQAVLRIQGVPNLRIVQNNPYRVRPNERVRLECIAEGNPRPNVVWRRYRQLFPAHAVPIHEVEGQAVLEIARVTHEDAGTYICTSSSPLGTSEERIQIIVEDDQQSGPIVPEVVVEDRVVTVAAGNRAVMRCFVRGTDRPIELRWIRSGNISLPSNYVIENGVLSIDDVKPQDSGEYTCLGIVEGDIVLFQAKTRLAVVAPPRIQLHPPRQSVRPGDTIYIDCIATGDQPITIDWSKIGGSLPHGVVPRDSRIEIRGIQFTDAGRYLCTAVNAAGKSEGVAEVIVEEDSGHREMSRKEETAFIGSNIELKCNFGTSPRSIQWARDDGTLPDNARETNNELWIRSVRLDNAGRYICTAISHRGAYSRDYVVLHVRESESSRECSRSEFRCTDGTCIDMRLRCNQRYDCHDYSDEIDCTAAPTLDVRIVPSKELIYMGDVLTLQCHVSGDPSARIEWSRLGQDGPFPDNIRIRGGTLTVRGVRSENGGVYRCAVDTFAGVHNQDYVLAIQDVPTYSPDAVETRSAPYGTTVVMDCQTTLEPPVAYTWSKQGDTLPPEASANQDGTLTIENIKGQDAGTYICTARNNYITIDIPTNLVVTGVVPYFVQAPLSYMIMPTLPDAYLTFEVEISIKPENPNGLILYNGQSHQMGDFISLGLSNGHIEFRYELGSGMMLLKSEKPIEIGKWHIVKITRNKKDGTLKVDNETEVSGSASGRNIGLDLLEPLYIGGVPDFSLVSKQIGFDRGFVGCISLFKVGTVIHELIKDAESFSVTHCETCATSPCQNSGVCQEAALSPTGYKCICPAGFYGHECEKVGDACYPGVCGEGRCVNNAGGGFMCYCPFGKSGTKCEKDIVIVEPALSDDAYIAYQSPKDSLRKMNLNLKVKPRKIEDGILMYSAQAYDGSGDFTSLSIKNKSIEFRFDTGSGPAILRSPEKLEEHEWVTIAADREMRFGTLVVGDGPPVTGESPGQTQGLNLRLPLYIGGYDKQQVTLSPLVEVTHGFDGCIGHIEVNSVPLDLVNAVVDSANVADCGSYSPCQRYPCLNDAECREIDKTEFECICSEGFSGKLCERQHGVCETILPCKNGAICENIGTTYKCHCPIGFKGEICSEREEFLDPESIRISGDSYLTFDRDFLPHTSSLADEIIKFSLSTFEDDGLIFFHGQGHDISGSGKDFLEASIVDGRVEFRFELGSGTALIKSMDKVNDGRKHSIVLKRKGKEGSLIIDDSNPQYGESPGILQMLNTIGDIYIGGIPNYSLMTGGRHKHGFMGCISDLEIGNSGVLNIVTSAKFSSNVRSCDDSKISSGA